ncbi:hypothetical protein [Paraburkholderia sp. J8-2]|uniref:hypothetical protein n=1 Tax=Paraburkholderia sp. J8-2 TaxID=2805440 RepID=UPI002AB5F1D0|nr:hypothetical protein [Paraburkholderia sp. J8-2]
MTVLAPVLLSLVTTPASALILSQNVITDGAFVFHVGALTPENQYDDDYVVSRAYLDIMVLSAVTRGFSIIPSDHPLFGKPERRYFEGDAFSSVRCLDSECKKVVATTTDGQEIQVDQLNFEYKYAGNPISADYVLPIRSVDITPMLKPDATVIPTERRNIPVDLVAFLRRDPSMHEIHFLTKEMTKASADRSKAIDEAARQANVARRQEEERDQQEKARIFEQRMDAQQRQAEARFIHEPVNHTISCTSGSHIMRAGANIDSVTYSCSGLPEWDQVSIRQLQGAGYEVDQTDQQPVQLADDRGFVQGTGYRVNLLMRKVR